MEELVGFCSAELVVNPTNDSLNRRTQHLVQPNLGIINPLRNHLRSHHCFPSQHLSNPPLATHVLSQRVCVEGVRGDFLVAGAGTHVRTRVEEHQEISFEDPTTDECKPPIMPNKL